MRNLSLILTINCDGELRVLSFFSASKLSRANTAAASERAGSARPDCDEPVALLRKSVTDAAPDYIRVKNTDLITDSDWQHASLLPSMRREDSVLVRFCFVKSLSYNELRQLYIATTCRTVMSFAIGLSEGSLVVVELDLWVVPFDVALIDLFRIEQQQKRDKTAAEDAADDDQKDVLTDVGDYRRRQIRADAGGVDVYSNATLSCTLLPSRTDGSAAQVLLSDDVNVREAVQSRWPLPLLVTPTWYVRRRTIGSAVHHHHGLRLDAARKTLRVELNESIAALHFMRRVDDSAAELVAVCRNGALYAFDFNNNLRRCLLNVPVRAAAFDENQLIVVTVYNDVLYVQL